MIEFSNIIVYISITFVFIAAVILIISLITFASFLVKLVVVEILTNLLMAGIALWAFVNHQPVLIDACLTLALIMFLGIVAYYQFLHERETA